MPCHATEAPPTRYPDLAASGELGRRGRELWDELRQCRLCPRLCGANRAAGERGFCGARDVLEISSHGLHFGEERPLVGRRGSGTIFFTHCSLRCVFCINHDIAQEGVGASASLEHLARLMLELQAQGAANINLVSPTHYSPHILLALEMAAGQGLRLPLVYNTCGYERREVLGLLEGVVDIYLPDIKYFDGDLAALYSRGAADYPERAREALWEMHRQVGVAHPGPDGLMQRGLMVRHLVMPAGVSGDEEVIDWIAANLPRDTYLNLMSQYRPTFLAFDFPEISRRITAEEYRRVVNRARERGLGNLAEC